MTQITITQDLLANGRMTVKNGRKTTAKIVDYSIAWPEMNRQYRYCVEVPLLGGSFDCADINEVNAILSKYVYNLPIYKIA